MTIRKIAQAGEPLLRRVAAEVTEGDLASSRVKTLIDDMIETMRDADGAGLAAPQVFESLRICVIEVVENPRYPAMPPIPLIVLVNPVLEPDEGRGTVEMYEGCLSVPGLRGRVQRPRCVAWRALDRRGERIEGCWEGAAASVIQHEVDHLDGVLFVDRAETRTLAFLREYERHVPHDARIVDRIAS